MTDADAALNRTSFVAIAVRLGWEFNPAGFVQLGEPPEGFAWKWEVNHTGWPWSVGERQGYERTGICRT